MQQKEVMESRNRAQGPPYCVNIDGTEHSWPRNTITTEEIAELGGWDPSLGVIEIDRDNNERTLAPGEVVELRPGHGFCKKIRFRRGLVAERRHELELQLLRTHYPEVECEKEWFRIPGYGLPPAWSARVVDVAFKRNPGHPAAGPYGIYVPVGLRVNGNMPTNYTEPASDQPAFAGSWGVFSWQPAGWRAAVEQAVGWSLLDWARGFAVRFAELN